MSFCLEEVFEMACQIERNGADFYKLAAEQASSEAARELFRELAEWEVRHEAAFRDMRHALPEGARTEYYDPEGEAARYLDTMVKGKVFNAKDATLLPPTMSEIFRAAIAKEKDSILFYLGMKDAVPQGREHLDRIIGEEMRHIRILTEAAADMSAAAVEPTA
jgi:rubrerythrin